jgi:epoxyqueuosine reductase
MKNLDHTQVVKSVAGNLGFDFCGIARAVPLDDDARKLESWLGNGLQGTMHYMENHFDLRVNPQKLFPGAKSVITLLHNYYPDQLQDPHSPKVSKYAYGKDYHAVIRHKLNHFLALLKEEIGEIHGRGFVDSAPVLERTWAVRSGLGWVGKNGNLINKNQGSFLFIATLVVDIELKYDDPFAKDFCGSCRKCIDACPTEAILEGKVIDGSKCISYYTIELKEALIPEEARGKMENWIFGCDICQDVCPWNRFSKPTKETAFKPIPEILNLDASEWEQMSEEKFEAVFRESPLKRPRYTGIKRNLRFIRLKADTHLD